MPIPKPTPRETQREYLTRAMKHPVAMHEYPDEQQRLAHVYAQWRDRAVAAPANPLTPEVTPDQEPDADIDDEPGALVGDPAEDDPSEVEPDDDVDDVLVREDGTTEKPYGDVEYADPGYQEDGVKRYPIDTAAHAKAAWSYINQEKNAGKYSAGDLAKVKGRIKAAAKKFGIEIADDQTKSETKSTVPTPPRRPRQRAMPGWMTEHAFHTTKLSFRAVQTLDPSLAPLPPGVCGRLTGVALTYDVADDYGTVFLPGALTRTRAEAVNRGKVKLFADHGPFTTTHVGVVRSIDDIGDAALMTADLFDTEAGREMKQYLEAVLASGSDTGLSIGFRPVDKVWRSNADGDPELAFKEIALREISITPVPAVPGTNVTSVRHEATDGSETPLLERALRSILAALPEREARAVFDAVYPTSTRHAGADHSDRRAAPLRGASTRPDAGRGTESATGTAMLATVEDRVRALRTAAVR